VLGAVEDERVASLEGPRVDLDERITGARREGQAHRCVCTRRGLLGREVESLLLGCRPLLARLDRALSLLHRKALQLDRAELAPTMGEILLLLPEPGLSLGEVTDEASDVGLACVEIVRSEAEQSLHRGTGVGQELLAPLQIRERLLEPSCPLLELPAMRLDDAAQALLRRRLAAPEAADDPAEPARFGMARDVSLVLALRASHVRAPVTCDRWAVPKPSNSERPTGFWRVLRVMPLSCREVLPRRVKDTAREADRAAMDANGARLLAARIRAGVSVGSRIELTGDVDCEQGLRAGDRGVVNAIGEHGLIVVQWDRGFSLEIDPDATPFQRLAA
jgi:hypothetical protein